MKRVLLLGANHASTMNNLKKGFDINGIKCKALSFDNARSFYNKYDKIDCLYPDNIGKERSKIGRAFRWRFIYYVLGPLYYLKYLLWADVVIYYSFPTYGNMVGKRPEKKSVELKFIDLFVKRKYVWFTGSDIRDPLLELKINPYFKYAWENMEYEYKTTESTETSLSNQRLFKRYNFNVIVWDQYPFVDREIFKEVIILPHASTIEKVEPIVISKRKLIVHAPSAPVAKGSDFVLAAIKKLRQRRDDFDFMLLHNMSNKDYQIALSKSDILVDQLIWGAYGVAAQQALEAGKVVVAYLTADRIEKIYGQDCALVNANIDNLDVILNSLLDDTNISALKVAGQAYYNTMHSPGAVVRKVISALSI